ncbi:MAG TPA: hypothetical protein VFJ99_04065 [Solirubrobacterales bacterium]|nr:hypothetical protein [Solirubrobacterales bacterium]
MRSPASARVTLWLLFGAAASIGLIATIAPHTFYEDFPFLAHWVDRLPPYNEHLVTDVGGLYLGFAVLFAWAAVSLQPTLARAAATAWILTEALHLAFHATHLEHFDTGDAIGQVLSLALLLMPAAVAIWATGPAAPPTTPPPSSAQP